MLSSTTNSLREALASSNARGQWGERMAEDVLRLAGFLEGVNYRKRTAVVGDGRGIPDFTFLLPKGHVLFMDVKFPMAAYLRYLDATTEAERSAHRATFVRDVRARVRELADASTPHRRPVDGRQRVAVRAQRDDQRVHPRERPRAHREAMASKVVICSPLTLFAFLGVIRQAFDNFVIEETSQEILQLLGKFGQQWGKYTESVDKVKRQFDTAQPIVRRTGHHPPASSSSGRSMRSRNCAASSSCRSTGSCSGSTTAGEIDNVRELGA